jgi:thioredoxin 2
MIAMAAAEFDERGIVVACPACGQKNRLAYQRLGEAVRCAKCKEMLDAPKAPLDIRATEDFEHLVAHAALPVIVDYWAPWCGPCRMVAPEIEKLASRQAGRAIVVKVNTDELPDLGQRFRVMSIPTLAVFAGGREVSRIVGARPAEEIERFVEQAAATIQR